MQYYLYVSGNEFALSKGICYIGLSQDEIEITEEQYNQMNEFPLKLAIEDGKIVAWERIEREYEPVIENQRDLTLDEEIIELKQLIADLASLQLGV